MSENRPKPKNIKEINEFLQYNFRADKHPVRLIKGNNSKDLTLDDLQDLKNSRDYLNHLFNSFTQTLRNDTYKGKHSTLYTISSHLCQSCNKPKSTFKILCFDCATK